MEESMRIDPEAVEQVRAVLADSTRVDDRRISVRIEHDEVVLGGAVATPEEATVAAMLAEQVVPEVVNAIQVDPALREGTGEPRPAEHVRPADGEVLVGDVDPFAGDGTALTSDMQRALDENDPLDPPDAPYLAAPPGEERGAETAPDPVHAGDPEIDPLDEQDQVEPAAADLSAEDLRRAAEGGGALPGLDPMATPLPAEPAQDLDPNGEPLTKGR
jgi:hypothetical protein